MKALGQLKSRMGSDIKKPCVVITTVNAVMRKVIPPQYLSSMGGLNATTGGRLDENNLKTFLSENGYSRTDTVRDSGEFAIRGGIVDLWPATADAPVRLDLFGAEVESIKEFDPVTQKSSTVINSLSLNPATEIPMTKESISRFRSTYRELFGAVNNIDPLYEAITDGRKINGTEHWQSLFFEEMVSVFDYVPNAIVSMDHQCDQAMVEAWDQIEDFYQARQTLAKQTAESNKKNKSNPQSIYHAVPIDSCFTKDMPNAEMFSPLAANETDAKQGRDFGDVRALPDGDVFAAVKTYFNNHIGKKIIVNAYSDGARERLKGLLDAQRHCRVKNMR